MLFDARLASRLFSCDLLKTCAQPCVSIDFNGNALFA
jgi:hypothetical protein